MRVFRKTGREWSIYNVNEFDTSSFGMSDADSVDVDSVIARYDNMVEVRGAVFRPGQYEVGGDINTVKSLLQAAEGVTEEAFTARAVMHRLKADRTLEDVAGDACRSGKALAQQERSIAEIAEHHDDLAHNAAGDAGGRSAAHLFIHQRSDQRHHALDDQGARSVVRIAEENVCQHRADAARRKAIPGAQQPAGQQHEAVAQIHIALHRRGDLHDHRRHADKRRKQCGKDKLSDLFIVHDWVLLCFGCWPYYIPSWYYSYSQNKTNYADQICPKLEKTAQPELRRTLGRI